MAVHLLIVDALNLIRRIHAVQGSPCVDTCLHALEQLIVHSQPTHAVAVFDDEDRAHGWRHQRLPEYKAGRAPMPETLVAEMPALRAAFEQRGIRCWASPGSEADDLAATLAVKVARRAIRPPLSPPTKATASCCRPPSASATTFRSAGWTPPSSPASSASPRSSWRITGGWRGSAARRCRAWRALDPKAPPSC